VTASPAQPLFSFFNAFSRQNVINVQGRIPIFCKAFSELGDKMKGEKK